MRCYAKIDNPLTKTVHIGVGTNHTFYRSMDMILMDVEKSDVDEKWYVAGHAPCKTDEEKRREEIGLRISELQSYLDATDWYAIRYAETGVSIPEEVRAHRQSSREEIDALRLEEIELK